MESGTAAQIILPLALFTIMFGVGITLRVSEFKSYIQNPKPVIIGALAQLLLLPLIGLIVVTVFALPPAMAVGIMILTFAPGGATSNMITLLARGDTAMSVSLTAVSGLVTPFTIPLLAFFAVAYWLGEQAAIAFPVLETMLKLFAIAVLPAILGVIVNHLWPEFCRKAEGTVKIMACLFLFIVVLGIVRANWDSLPALILQLGPAVLSLVMIAMGGGYLLASKLAMSQAQSVTLAVELGIQNAATALMVTTVILDNPVMSASALIYGILMNIPAFLLIAYRNLPNRGEVNSQC